MEQIAVSTLAPVSGLTYDELCRLYPDDDGYRRELIDGELYVSPAPGTRHQRVVLALVRALSDHADAHGGECFVAPFEMWFGPTQVPQPDVLYLTAHGRRQLDDKRLHGPADLAIEVSSPSSRRTDLLVKRRQYEHFGVSEYWVVDLEQDLLVVHRLVDEHYGEPTVLARGQEAASPAADGFTTAVDDVLGPPSPPTTLGMPHDDDREGV